MPELALRILTIYGRPSDFPENLVVRGRTVHEDGTFEVDEDEELFTPTPHGVRAAREYCCEQGHSCCVGREPDDDPIILESWI